MQIKQAKRSENELPSLGFLATTTLEMHVISISISSSLWKREVHALIATAVTTIQNGWRNNNLVT